MRWPLGWVDFANWVWIWLMRLSIIREEIDLI